MPTARKITASTLFFLIHLSVSPKSLSLGRKLTRNNYEFAQSKTFDEGNFEFEPKLNTKNIDENGEFQFARPSGSHNNNRKNLQSENSGPVNFPTSSPKNKDECVYKCQYNGGCTATYFTSRFFSSSIQGSCLPPDVGGECSGIPRQCFNCDYVCQEYLKGEKIAIKVDRRGNEIGEPYVTKISKNGRPTKPRGSLSQDTCTYTCKQSGGCSVRLNSRRLVTGSDLGSCFSKYFGGRCRGTPEGCSDCLEVCKQTNQNTLILPATS